ncbi:uncharacterized protein LOC131875008 [Cryptomeria japonica]|uniref:uncharacterized protein LOC131875008 n=1 Tax=Cryptomeria japonica TaxID=3369 RepID=UPI0027DA9459|nr:uncharacterized protein LOC131875008 [Cryptomeria japonica]
MGEKDKPPNILQVDGTLSEKNVGPGNPVGGSRPREVVLENGKEIRRWSTLFGTRPSGKSSLPPVQNILDPTGGKFSISIPDLVLDHNISSMSNSLVGKFMGPCPNIEVVRAYVKRKWALKGNVEISALPKGLLSFAFSCEEDKIRILCGNPWLARKIALVLQKWHPNLNMSEYLLVQVPVWVKLPGLPLEFWAESIFLGIASSFGEILSIDPIIASRRRLTHARFCIGVTHDVDMLEQIDIVSKLGTWKQQIEYESIPFSCFHCKKEGHWAKHYPLKPIGDNKKAKNPVESRKALEKMTWQVKNTENKKAGPTEINYFGPLGENKDVVSSTSVSKHHSPQENLRKECMGANNIMGGQIPREEIKEQNESSKETTQMVITDTLTSKEALNEENQKDKNIKEVDKSKEGEITGSHEEKADSSPLTNSSDFQEAQNCVILGQNLSNSDHASKTIISSSHDSR